MLEGWLQVNAGSPVEPSRLATGALSSSWDPYMWGLYWGVWVRELVCEA